MIRRIWTTLDLVQRARLFKIIASCVVVAVALGGIGAYSIAVERTRNDALAPLIEMERQMKEQAQAEKAAREAEARRSLPPGAPVPSEVKKGEAPTDAYDASMDVFRGIVSAQHTVSGVAVGIGIGAGLMLVVIWLELGITYLLLGTALAVVMGGASLAGAAEKWAPIGVGVIVLGGAFVAIMKLLGILLSGPGPVFAIARTVLSEAVRLKVGGEGEFHGASFSSRRARWTSAPAASQAAEQWLWRSNSRRSLSEVSHNRSRSIFTLRTGGSAGRTALRSAAINFDDPMA